MVPILLAESPGRREEHPADFPRLPVAEIFSAPVQAVLGGRVVARATRGVRLLQRGKAPLYFLPPSSLALRHVRPSDTLRIDDIGLAVHLHLASGGHIARDGAWYYPGPDPELALIAGMACLDPEAFDQVTLDGVRVFRGDEPGTWVTPYFRGGVVRRQGAA